MKSFKQYNEAKFDGISGGEKNNPLKTKKKLVVKVDGSDIFVPLDDDGLWYLHTDGKEHFGANARHSTGYFKTKSAAQSAIKKYQKSGINEAKSKLSVAYDVKGWELEFVMGEPVYMKKNKKVSVAFDDNGYVVSKKNKMGKWIHGEAGVLLGKGAIDFEKVLKGIK